MKKILYWAVAIIGLLIATAIGKGVGKSVGNSLSKPPQAQIEQEGILALERAAEEVNRTLPKMIDENTRYDRMVAGPGLHVSYYYTLPYISSSDLDLQYFYTLTRAEVTQKACIEEKSRKALYLGLRTSFNYYSNDGVPVAQFDVTKFDCN